MCIRDSGISWAQSFTLTFITLSESDTLYYYCPAINSTISSTFTLIQPPTPCAVFNKTVEFNDAVSISGELTLTGDVITTGTFSGSGASLTSIPNTALDNSMITINGSSVALGDSMSIVASQWTTDASDIYYLDGNVGIGTTDPSFSLDVSGSINCNTLLVDGAAPSFGGDYVKLDVSYSTSSQNYLDVSASTSSGSGSTVWTQDASFNIYYDVGNVGVGMTDPSYSLDVSGDARISGALMVGGGTINSSVTYDVSVNVNNKFVTVSYTHLTLPTICSV